VNSTRYRYALLAVPIALFLTGYPATAYFMLAVLRTAAGMGRGVAAPQSRRRFRTARRRARKRRHRHERRRQRRIRHCRRKR
jgi:hypothetical protein